MAPAKLPQDQKTFRAGSPKSLKGLAGVLGFEPRNGGIKIRCLTTWLYPNTGVWRPRGGTLSSRTIIAATLRSNDKVSVLARGQFPAQVTELQSKARP